MVEHAASNTKVVDLIPENSTNKNVSQAALDKSVWEMWKC